MSSGEPPTNTLRAAARSMGLGSSYFISSEILCLTEATKRPHFVRKNLEMTTRVRYVKPASDQPRRLSPQVSGLAVNGLIIRWSQVRSLPGPQYCLRSSEATFDFISEPPFGGQKGPQGVWRPSDVLKTG